MRALAFAFVVAIAVALGITFMAILMVPPETVEAPMPEAVVETIYLETPVPVPYPVMIPQPYAIADEVLGAYRVNGFVTFGGGAFADLTMTAHPQLMACFPYYED
jgi:hypothetical protein